jgi:hypothetical protein
METTLSPKPPGARAPAPNTEPPESFPPSGELGDQLHRLAEAQAEIDRRKAEELARLRAIQSRD